MIHLKIKRRPHFLPAVVRVLPVFLLLTSAPLFAQVPFTKGINLTGWFQAGSARQIQFSRYTRQDFENIKELGCDVVRLPVNLHFMTNGAPGYTIDPLFFEFLDQVVDWAEDLEMHLILDNHTFDPAVNTDPDVGVVLKKVWSQMATHYKDRSDLIYYEILNEPHGISDAQWNAIQKNVVEKIREIDTRHTIIIGPADWNSYNNLDDMPVYEDDNLIYTFHFYDPFIFTHQGATWTDPSLAPLSNVPFPYQAEDMPDFPSELNGTWIQSAFNDYANTGNAGAVKALLDIAIQFKNERNVPVFCGEFGVYMPNSDNAYRVAWYEMVRMYLEENGIPWTSWDYHGGFGIFEEDGAGLFNHDLNIPLLEALGLNLPPQTEYVQKPDSAAFMLYTDHIGERIVGSGYTEGTLDFYSTEQPNNESYCISWTGAVQYNNISFDFQPDKDLSKLVAEDFALDFIFRGDAPAFSFDVRFLDTKSGDPEDHPWRMRYTIDENLVPFDKKWHHVRIPLKDFTEHGAWDNEWFNPEGKFDWTAIDRFEIVAEHADLNGGTVWFDNIHIANLDTARVLVDTEFNEPPVEEEITGTVDHLEERNVKVYPNPVSNVLLISASTGGEYRLQLYDGLGKLVLERVFSSTTKLNMSNLAKGIYVLKLSDNEGKTHSRKVLKK